MKKQRAEICNGGNAFPQQSLAGFLWNWRVMDWWTDLILWPLKFEEHRQHCGVLTSLISSVSHHSQLMALCVCCKLRCSRETHYHWDGRRGCKIWMKGTPRCRQRLKYSHLVMLSGCLESFDISRCSSGLFESCWFCWISWTKLDATVRLEQLQA